MKLNPGTSLGFYFDTEISQELFHISTDGVFLGTRPTQTQVHFDN